MRTQNSLQVVGIPASPTALALNAQLFSRLLLDLRQRDAPEPCQVGWCVVLSHLTGTALANVCSTARLARYSWVCRCVRYTEI